MTEADRGGSAAASPAGRWRLGLAALAVAGLVAGLIVAGRGLAVPRDGVVAAGASAPARAAPAAAAAAATPPAVPPAVSRGRPSSPASAPGSLEVCGVGPVAAADVDERLEREVADATQAAMDRIAGALAASADEGRRAAGLFLSMQQSTMAAVLAAQEQRQRDGVDCGKQACTQPDPPAAREARDALARLASASRTPTVYALAFQACIGGDRKAATGACQLISAAQWARLEPDNAVPWLFAAELAQQRSDPAAVQEALHRVAQARHSDMRFGQLTEAVMGEAPTDANGWVTSGIFASSLGIEVTARLPAFLVVTRHCDGKAIQDANRRATCDGVAELLVDRSSTLIEMGIGLSLGKRLGWPTERLAAIEQRRDASHAVLSALQPFGGETMSLDCAGMERLRSYSESLAAGGELGMVRAAIRRDPQSEAGLARRFRQQRADQAERAASAASSAAAASAP